jgi:murein DD-endopeptidase MepM/ murein hydrolase activator NlpD
MRIPFFIPALITLFPFLLSAQVTTYPKNYFRNPLDVPMKLAANFGEIRANHWHMGLDIRTEQRENLPVYAAADGYIAKVRIEPFGFGQAIFINHANGYTTVYGHLNNFAPQLAQYITAQQYKMESWQADLDFPPNLFPVTKGQLIAYSGNTGGSQGPHLHFEIRDTKTTRCLNPLLFGMPIADDVPPGIVRLGLYDRSRSVYEQSPKLFPVKKTGAIYGIPKTPVIKTWLRKLSFAIQAFDKLSGSANPNGIYGAALFFDDRPVINFFIDSIDYIETHAINAQVDYKYSYNGGVDVQHLSQLPGDRSRVYHHINGDGVAELNDNAVHTVRIEVMDAYMNTSVLSFQVQHDDNLTNSVSSHTPHEQFNPNQVNTLSRSDFELNLATNILYDTIQPVYTETALNETDAVSSVHRFCDASIPAGDYFSVHIRPNKSFPSIWGDKIVIKNVYGSRSTVRKAEWQNGWLAASFDDFGTYQAFADVEAPEINLAGRGDTLDLSAALRIVFWPSDNFGIKNFRAELDGKWLRFTNDKGRAYIYNFDERCPYGTHFLKVTVTDLAGNTTIKNWWFKKYPYTAPKKVIKKKGVSSKKKATIKKKGLTKKKK